MEPILRGGRSEFVRPSWPPPPLDAGLNTWLTAVWRDRESIRNEPGFGVGANMIYGMYGGAGLSSPRKYSQRLVDLFVAYLMELKKRYSHELDYDKDDMWEGCLYLRSRTCNYAACKRIYIHCKTSSDGLAVCWELAEMMTRAHFGIECFKIWGPGACLRKDTIVVYLLRGDGAEENLFQDRSCARLVAGKLRCRYAHDLPLGVTQWSKGVAGVGVADEPPKMGVIQGDERLKLHSFGSFYADHIYAVLVRGRWKSFN